MFDGVKLLCLRHIDNKREYSQCLNPLIVPSAKFLKIANSVYKCPACGHKSNNIQPFFIGLIELQQAVNNLRDTGFYLRNYTLGYMGCFDDAPLRVTPCLLDLNDWGDRNLQVSSITLANIAEPGVRIDIWEDCFADAAPYRYPFAREFKFSSAMRRKAINESGHGIKNLHLLKDLIKKIRIYNAGWLALLDSLLCAAPVDLTDQIYTHLNNVVALDRIYPEETYE